MNGKQDIFGLPPQNSGVMGLIDSTNSYFEVLTPEPQNVTSVGIGPSKG